MSYKSQSPAWQRGRTGQRDIPQLCPRTSSSPELPQGQKGTGIFSPGSLRQRGLKPLVLLLVILFQSPQICRECTQPCSINEPWEDHSWWHKTKGRFGTPLKLKRNENLHKKPCEATFTEGGKPGSDMRCCARLKCLLVTMFHLPSLDARWQNYTPDSALLKQHRQYLFGFPSFCLIFLLLVCYFSSSGFHLDTAFLFWFHFVYSFFLLIQ